MSPARADVDTDRSLLLRERLGFLCHAIRWVGVAWIAWALISIVMLCGDPASAAATYGRLFQRDLSGLPQTDHLAALAVLMIDWGIAAAVVFFVFRLFGHYLNGQIFTGEAVDAMRCVGVAGVAAVAADVLSRPLLGVLLTRHLGDGQPFHIWTEPNDLLHLLMALFILALAHVFKTGVEIADENRQIV